MQNVTEVILWLLQRKTHQGMPCPTSFTRNFLHVSNTRKKDRQLGRIVTSFQGVQPSDLNSMAKIILVVKAVDCDCFTGGGCVNKALAVQIYSNMPGSLAHPEEYEITRQRLINIERVRGAQLFSGGPRHQDARLTVGIEHETATVKTPRIIPTVVIGNTDHPSSRDHNLCKNGGVTRRGSSWSSGSDIR